MSYIKASDIKSNLAEGFNLTDYIVESDEEVNDVAQRLGVRDTDNISTPVHYKIKRLAVVFVLMRLAQDRIGTVSPDVVEDKYHVLYDVYKTELKELRPQITYEMVTGNVNRIVDRTTVHNLYRG